MLIYFGFITSFVGDWHDCSYVSDWCKIGVSGCYNGGYCWCNNNMVTQCWCFNGYSGENCEIPPDTTSSYPGILIRLDSKSHSFIIFIGWDWYNQKMLFFLGDSSTTDPTSEPPETTTGGMYQATIKINLGGYSTKKYRKHIHVLWYLILLCTPRSRMYRCQTCNSMWILCG